MIAWLAANWLTIVVALLVAALAALCLHNLFPGKSGKGGCSGCGGSCAGCGGGCAGCTGSCMSRK